MYRREEKEEYVVLIWGPNGEVSVRLLKCAATRRCWASAAVSWRKVAEEKRRPGPGMCKHLTRSLVVCNLGGKVSHVSQIALDKF